MKGEVLLCNTLYEIVAGNNLWARAWQNLQKHTGVIGWRQISLHAPISLCIEPQAQRIWSERVAAKAALNSKSHDKTNKMACAPSEDSDQPGHRPSLISLRCALNGLLRAQCFFMRTAKTLNRLGGCPGWSESSLGAQPHYWFCHEAPQLWFCKLCHALVLTLFS